MKKSVYIETSIPSYLTARSSHDAGIAAWQRITRQWVGQKADRLRTGDFRAVCKTHLALPNGVKNGLKMLIYAV